MPPERLYLLAVYYAVTTVATVGTGDITPSNTRRLWIYHIAELIFTLVYLVIGVWIYTNSISFMSTVFHDPE